MSLSSETFERWAAAHKLGMEYHHHLTLLITNGRQDTKECERLAQLYLDAFLNLEENLSTLEASDDVIELRKSAKKHIELVRGDLEQLQDRALKATPK